MKFIKILILPCLIILPQLLISQPKGDTKEVATVTKDYYNNPNHSFFGFDGNIITRMPTVTSGSPLLGAHAKVFIVPASILYAALHVQAFTSLA